MNQRELAQIKRRLNPDKHNVTVVQGCYIASDGRIITTFTHSVADMAQDECDKYMGIFRKVLGGTQGKNLQHLDFTADQVMSGEQVKLLLKLRDTSLRDENALEDLYRAMQVHVGSMHQNASQSVDEQQTAANQLVLLMYDAYDIPVRSSDGEQDHDRSDEMFGYIICAVCPVKQNKPALAYVPGDEDFHSKSADWVVGNPELGFMYPAFEERSANAYRAMYYTRDAGALNEAFVQSVFGTDLVMPAKEQNETFQVVLQEALGEECSLQTFQAIHSTVSAMIEQQKSDKSQEPLSMTGKDVSVVLKDCGVSEEKAEIFEEKFNDAFGEHVQMPAINMVTPKQFKVDTPSVSIKVDPNRSDLLQTREIDGKYYIMVLADGDIEVNGVRINQI